MGVEKGRVCTGSEDTALPGRLYLSAYSTGPDIMVQIQILSRVLLLA